MAINKNLVILALLLCPLPGTAADSALWCHLDWNDGRKTVRAWFQTQRAECDSYAPSSITTVFPRPTPHARGEHFSGGLIVRLVHGLADGQAEDFFSVNGIQHFGNMGAMRGVYWADTPADLSTLLLADRLAASPLVRHVTPNWRKKLVAR
jgi:hypothetical protein